MHRWFVGLALAMAAVAAQAQQVTQPVVIDDYPRYATAPPAKYQDTLRRIGRALAGAAASARGDNMLQLSVVGHADFDAKGRQFENEVSVDRAHSVREAIVASFNEQADAMHLDDRKRRLVSFEYVGMGTSQALHPASADMSLRVLNRRVEVTWVPVAVVRPTNKVAIDRCASIVPASASTPLRKKRIGCACTLLRDNARAGDDTYSLKLFQEALGSRNGRNLSAAEMAEVFRKSRHHYRNDVHQASQSNPGNDQEFMKRLEEIDHRVISDMDQIQKQIDSGAPLLHDRILTADIGKKQLDPAHVYACYAGASMRDIDQNR